MGGSGRRGMGRTRSGGAKGALPRREASRNGDPGAGPGSPSLAPRRPSAGVYGKTGAGQLLGPGWTKVRLLLALSRAFFSASW
jgi:hypothetical protein